MSLWTFDRTKHLINNNNNWAYELSKTNYTDLKSCDCIFAIVNGNPTDEGVMDGLRISIKLNKKIFFFKDDFRNCSNNYQYPLNLMLIVELPKEMWTRSYFEKLENITSTKTNFLNWVKSK